MNKKEKQVLLAAVDVIIRYGYRRTTMDDIASAAGISRPAVYQYFRNKKDVLRNGISLLVEQAFMEAEAAKDLAPDIVGARIQAFLITYMGFYLRLILSGPHSEELLDMKNRLGHDINVEAQKRLVDKLNEIAGKPHDSDTGYILAHSAEGLKYNAPDEATLEKRISKLVERYFSRPSAG